VIQRLQTVFLAFATLLTLSVYFTPIYEKAMADPQLWIGIGLAASLLIAVILNVVGVFLYNNRKSQLSWVKRAALFQVIGFGFCTGVLFSLGGIGTYLWDEALGTGLVLLGLIFQILAMRYIRKDEELVRSMDRIR
jgi:protein-S-isoprenylcysteine O-methyltransferase Ste14